jgi:hypothetical protein
MYDTFYSPAPWAASELGIANQHTGAIGVAGDEASEASSPALDKVQPLVLTKRAVAVR